MYRFSRVICVTLTILALTGCFHSADEAQRWEIHPQGVTSFSLSRNGQFGLIAAKENGIVLWDLKSNQQLASFGFQDPESNTVIASQISDNNRYAITATSQNFAVWDLAWGKSEGLWSISDGNIRDVAISNNGKQVLLALSNGKALFVDLGTGRRLEFLAHREKVNSVAISPNGKYGMSGGNDHVAYLWDTNTGQILNTFEHSHRITRVALDREGRFAFSADGDDMAVIWDLSTGRELSRLDLFHRHPNFSVARFSDDGTLLATGTPGRRVQLWSVGEGTSEGRWVAAEQLNTRPPSAVVYDVAFTPDNQVISATSAGIAQAWNIEQH
ncbi:hypothetical protein CS022_09230 [Veronia nyctiphanis]|uniref:Uncharacterized protein n=1 Tax=Veronia nyctiphanis TaxID=1278244 RepID=A0A4Q0YQL6_9GAMM|nr:hypothetical protein [Veronia nyctiphanis]RXJ73427.1 hypothetical protein CS022_09230 [Veronia nyctiphanis]